MIWGLSYFTTSRANVIPKLDRRMSKNKAVLSSAHPTSPSHQRDLDSSDSSDLEEITRRRCSSSLGPGAAPYPPLRSAQLSMQTTAGPRTGQSRWSGTCCEVNELLKFSVAWTIDDMSTFKVERCTQIVPSDPPLHFS